jgi:PAS domain S-box-containing protein
VKDGGTLQIEIVLILLICVLMACLGSMMGKLKSYKQGLEAMVQERTANLRKEIDHCKLTENSLRISEEKFRTVADYTCNWEYWISPAGDFIYNSPSCLRITGYHPSEFVNDKQLLLTIAHPADRDAMARHIDETLYGSGGATSFDYRILTKEGNICWMSHSCQPIFGDDGTYLGTRTSNRDITLRKRMENALKDALHKLQEHHVELETQNEDLLAAQSALGASQARYFELYDMAPVGY